MSNRERIRSISFFTVNRVKFNLVIAFVILLLANSSIAQVDSDSYIYTVKEGDFLTTIAVKLGSTTFWKPIFSANRDIIDDPDRIFPGQKLKIPPSVVNSDQFTGTIPEEETTAKSDEEESITEKTSASDSSDVTLEKFRNAFSELMENEKQAQTSSGKPVDAGIEFEGLVIDETRSKIGKDFFNEFYQNWDAPSEANNFLLTITEQPAPGMGTIVSVNLDNQKIFQSRLQPRRPVIEQQAQRAVAVSHQYLRQQILLSGELNGY